MKLDTEKALIEAILYLEGEPIDSKKIVRISGLSSNVVGEVLLRIKEDYDSPQHGLELVQIGGGFCFSPKKDLWDSLKSQYGKKNENQLSRAAMETLSIIAYSQPITKAEIESIRGVSADGMIKVLLEKNLIKIVGKKDSPGKPVQYGSTPEFLKVFRLNSIADLPKLEDLDREKFELDRE